MQFKQDSQAFTYCQHLFSLCCQLSDFVVRAALLPAFLYPPSSLMTADFTDVFLPRHRSEMAGDRWDVSPSSADVDVFTK